MDRLWRDSNPQSQHASGRILLPYTARPLRLVLLAFRKENNVDIFHEYVDTKVNNNNNNVSFWKSPTRFVTYMFELWKT